MMERRCPGIPGMPRGAYPPPPFNPSDYWAPRKWVTAYVGTVAAPLSDRISALESVPVLTPSDVSPAPAGAGYVKIATVAGKELYAPPTGVGSVSVNGGPKVTPGPDGNVGLEIPETPPGYDGLLRAAEASAAHAASRANPHGVTAAQAGAEPAGSVAAHESSSRPHQNVLPSLPVVSADASGNLSSGPSASPLQSVSVGGSKLASESFVNSSINAMAAFYITKNAAGDSFATKAELNAAIAGGTFYNGGEPRTPTKNDYLYVLADESATQIIPDVNPTTRYSFDGAQWAFQIVVNSTALTQAQIDAINSGVTRQVLESKLGLADVVAPDATASAGKAADAMATYGALEAKRGKSDFAVYGKAWEYKNGGTVVDNIMAEWGDPYGTGLGWRFLLDGGSPFPDAPISTDKDADHLAYGSYTADKVDAQVDTIAKTSEVAEALKSRRGPMDLTVYDADYPTEGQVWTWTNPDTGEKVSKSLNFRTLHYEDVYSSETYDFTGWIDADGESAYPGQPYVRVSAGIGATSGEVQVVHHGDEPDEEYTAAATRAAPDVNPHPTEDTLAKSSDVNEKIAKKADWDGGWTNDVDNNRYTVVFEDPYGWGYSQWWLYENGSRREYAGSMGDASSETLTWHAFSEWDANFDITFTRRLVLRRGDPDVATRKDLAGKRDINDFSVFGEWECDSSDCEVRWNGDGWGLWFSPGGFWLSNVNKGDEKSVSLSWSLDDSEIQFGPPTVTATREAGTLAQSSYVDSKADEFGEWTTDYSGSGEAPRVIWAKQGGLYGWWLFLHGSIESTYVGGEIDAVEMHWEPGDWSGGVSLTATRPRVLRVTGTGSVVKHDADGYYVEV